MADHQSDELTDTGRLRAIAEGVRVVAAEAANGLKIAAKEAAAEVRREAHLAADDLRHQTPLPAPQPPSDSSEHIRAIARDEAQQTCKGMIAQYQNDCVNNGPICGVWEEIGRMRDSIATETKQNAEERGEARGALKAQARHTTLIVAGVGAIGVGAQLFMLIWKAAHGG